MTERRAYRDCVLCHQRRDLVHILQAGTGRRQRSSNFLCQHGSCDASPPDLASLRTSDTRIIGCHDHLDLHPRRLGLLNCHAEVEHVTCVVHHDHEHTLARLHALKNASSDLLGTWGRKDGSCYGTRQKSATNEGCEGGLMAAAST